MLDIIVLSYFFIAGDVTGGSYSEDFIGPFSTKQQCESSKRDILGAAGSPNAPIRITAGECRHHETINRVNRNWSLMGPMIARRKAMGTVTVDIWKRPNAPHPVQLPAAGVQFPGGGHPDNQPDIKVQCSETGCRISVDGLITEDSGY